MYNPIQTALDIYGVLQAAAPLQSVNVAFYRKLRQERLIDFSSIFTKSRNGCTGRGILVCEPTARAQQKNVLMLDWVFPVIAVECPSMNDIQVGGPISAYQLCQIVADQMHNFSDTIYGTMNIDGDAIADAGQEFEFKDSSGMIVTIAKRVQFHILGRNTQTQRCGQLGSSVTGNTVTINPGLPTASSIYCTVDGSFPQQNNPKAVIYTAPMTVATGQLFRAVGYLNGYNNSACLSIQF